MYICEISTSHFSVRTLFLVQGACLFLISALVAFIIFVCNLDNQCVSTLREESDSWFEQLATATTYSVKCTGLQSSLWQSRVGYGEVLQSLPSSLKKNLTHLQNLLCIWYCEPLQLASQATNKPRHIDPRTYNSEWQHNSWLGKASRPLSVSTQLLFTGWVPGTLYPWMALGWPLNIIYCQG